MINFKVGDIVSYKYSEDNGVIIYNKKLDKDCSHIKIIFFKVPNRVFDYKAPNKIIGMWFIKVE